MTTEAQGKEGTGTSETTSTSAQQQPGPSTTEKKNETTTKTTTAEAGGDKTTSTTQQPKAPKTLTGDNDDIPDGEEMIQMSPRALNARLARSTKKQLREAFGTDDIDEVKKLVEKARAASEKEETERKARLTETERLKEEKAAAERERDEARSQLTSEQRARIVERQDSRITRVAEKYLDPDYIESEMPHLAADLRKAFEDKDPKLAKDESAWIEKWFQKRVELKPKLGKDFDAKKDGETPPEPKKVGLSNGAQTNERPSADRSVSPTGPKTAAPGKPNSMSQKELRDLGYQWK